MTQYIVVGVYQFLGFHLCNAFLEKGYEVRGLNWQIERSEYADEKSMFLDRNANFTFCPSFKCKRVEEETILCLDGYPFFQSSQLEKALSELDWLEEIINHDHLSVLIFISSKMKKQSKQWLEKIRDYSKLRCIYVDTLYGPWLPEKEQILMEDEGGAIYIEDFCKEWTKILALNASSIDVMSEDLREEKREKLNNDIGTIEESAISVKIPVYTKRHAGLQAIKDHQQKLKLLQEWNE